MHRHLIPVFPSLVASLLLFGAAKSALGQGFQTGVTYPAGAYPESAVAGDFNNDGKPDLIFANGCGDLNCLTTGTISVLLGRGNGTFTRKQYVAGPAGTSAEFVAEGDFNGDGNLDVVVVNNAINVFGTVSVLLGNGDGSFQAPVAYQPGPTPVSIAVGDFNRDGALDLAVVITSHNYVSILPGNGDGTFGTVTTFATENGPQGIVTADLNADGNLDLAVVNECGTDPLCETGSVSILLGTGDGAFQKGPSAAANSRPLAAAVGDFNGDGTLDLAVANACGTDFRCISPGTVAILLGNGQGNFQAPVNFTADFDTVRLAVGDFNGDRKLDAAALNYQTNDTSVWLGNGDGTLQPAVNYPVGNQPLGVAVGDFNLDGSSDLAVANENSASVSLMLNTRGTAETLTSSPNPSKAGQSVTFSCSVSASIKGSGTPTGTVTFEADSKIIGTSMLSNGKAALGTASLAPGRHKVQAHYSGGPSFNPNTSQVLLQGVLP